MLCDLSWESCGTLSLNSFSQSVWLRTSSLVLSLKQRQAFSHTASKGTRAMLSFVEADLQKRIRNNYRTVGKSMLC